MRRILAIIILSALAALQACSWLDPRREYARYIFRDFDLDAIEENSSQIALSGVPETIHFPDVDLDEARKVPFDSIFESVAILPLETSEESLIGLPQKIEIVNDTVYVLDTRKVKSLVRFSIDGKFIDRIGNVGQGPGEYVEPTNFYVYNDSIFVLDEFQLKLLSFDKSGAYHGCKMIPFFALQAAQFNDSTLVFRALSDMNIHVSSIENCRFWITDLDFNIRKHGFGCDAMAHLFDYNGMKWIGGNFVCFENSCDTLFVLDSSCTLVPKYALDFGGHRKKSFYSSNENYMEAFKNPDFYNIISCNMSPDFVDCVVTIAGNICLLLYSRNTQRIMACSNVVLEDSVSFPTPCMKRVIYNDCLVDCLDALAVPQDSATLGVWKRHAGGSFDGLKPDDNPVLVFYKLRKW